MEQYNVVQIWCGPINDVYEKYKLCMDQTKKFFKENGHEYIRIIKEDNKFENPIIDSDTLRFEMAQNLSNMLYMDCDLIFNEIPIFEEEGRPYFCHRSEKMNSANECLFYVNNCCDFFKNVFKEKEKRNIEYTFGWPNKIIRTKRTFGIDKSLYTHYRYTTGKKEV